MNEQEFPRTIALDPFPVAEVSGAMAALAEARTLTVVDQGSYEFAAGKVQGYKGQRKRLEDLRVFLTGPLNKIVKSYNDRFRQPLADLDEAEATIERSMTGYRAEQARMAEEARRRAEEAARVQREAAERKAREELAKAEAEAARKREEEDRQRRLAEEAAARARAAKEAGDKAAAAAAEKELEEAQAAERKAREQAEKVAAAGQARAATSIEQAQNIQAAPPVYVPPPAAAGSSARETWDFEITDPALVPREYLLVNDKAIRGVVKALKGNANIPGVRAYKTETLAFRSQ